MKGVNMKKKVIALFGQSGAGKDYLSNFIANAYENINLIRSTTTRPKRDTESQDAYNFITREEFEEKLLNEEFYEATLFNGWYYGTEDSTIDENKINVGVFNLEGIDALLADEENIELIPIEIYVPDKLRLTRTLTREENPDCLEICRRFITDYKDFKDKMNFPHYQYNNSLSYADKKFHNFLLTIPTLQKWLKTKK